MRTFSALFFASFIALSAICPQGFAFVRESSEGVFAIWPNSEVTLNLQVGCPDTPLTFWGPCWTDAVIDAANRWHGPDTSFRFLIQSPAVSANPCTETDEFRTIAFRSTMCPRSGSGPGFGFGSSVAVTYFFVNPSTGAFIDADTIFDAKRTWVTYPGPLQTNPAGTVVYDFHRVAIHELGHVLGLDHPDQAGQTVTAIMNSRVSNLDTTQPDDLAGIRAIYPATATTVQGVLENPQPDSAVSGISTISGWVCTANQVNVLVNDSIVIPAAYGTPRSDTRERCGDDNNGFSILVNWNELGSGTHQVVAFADGVEFGRATVTVSTFGTPFLYGANGTFIIPFNGRNVTLKWEEQLQNFVINGIQ